MLKYYDIVWLTMMISGLIVLCSMRKHLLTSLLSLEFLVLSIYMSLFSFLSYYNLSYYFLLIFLTFAVCEGAMGLGVLVSMIRTHGNDYVNNLSILGW